MRLFLCLALVGAASCGGAPPAAPATTAPSKPTTFSYDELVTAAQSYLETGKSDRAAQVAAEAAAKDGSRPEAFRVWARALATLQKLDESAAKYIEAQSRGDDSRELHSELASVYDVSGEYDRAIQVYRAYLGKHPDDAEFHQQIGLTLLLAKRPADGVKELRRASELAPNDLQVRQDLAYALFEAGDLEAAAKELTTVTREAPDRGDAWRLFAQVRGAQHRTKDAVANATRALEVNGRDAQALRLRARLKSAAEDHEGALADYEMLSRGLPEDAGAHLGAAGALIALGRSDQAKQRVDRAAELAGNHPWVKLRRAQLAWRGGDKQALATLQALGKEHPDSAEVWRELAEAAKKFGDAALRKEAQAALAKIEAGKR